MERPICVYTRSWRRAGAGLFAQELVGGLIDIGARVVFVSPAIDGERPRNGLRRLKPPRERTGDAPRMVRTSWSLARIAGGALSLLRARATARTFVVTIPDPLPLFLPVLALLRLSGARVLFVAHDPVPHALRVPARLRGLEVAANGACYALATTVVVLSEASRAKLREAFPRVSTPAAVIEHGTFVLGAPTPPPGDGTLLAFGTIRRNKGFLEAIGGVITARRAGVPVRLIVAGEPHAEDRGYADACARLAATAPDAVEMRPDYVDEDALPALVGACDALLMPYTSFFSQSGVALLAASNARPVIASAAGGLGDLFAEGMPAVPIATPVTADGVAAAVRAFADVPSAEWHERALAYRDVTIARRSWPVIAAAYRKLTMRER